MDLAKYGQWLRERLYGLQWKVQKTSFSIINQGECKDGIEQRLSGFHIRTAYKTFIVIMKLVVLIQKYNKFCGTLKVVDL